MSRCNQCNLEIKDNHSVCPLCHSVLEKTKNSENLYPNVRVIAKRIDLMIRVYAFVAIVLETFLAYFNYRTYEQSYWSVLVGVVLFYVFVALRVTFKEGYEYRTKSIILVTFGVICVVLIDLLTGFRGWSLNYVLPSAIILFNTGIVAAMIVNIRNWQSYMMIELFTILWSILPFILNRMGFLTKMNLSHVASGYSVLLFLGTIIIGGKRASNELKRRFHVR